MIPALTTHQALCLSFLALTLATLAGAVVYPVALPLVVVPAGCGWVFSYVRGF